MKEITGTFEPNILKHKEPAAQNVISKSWTSGKNEAVFPVLNRKARGYLLRSRARILEEKDDKVKKYIYRLKNPNKIGIY